MAAIASTLLQGITPLIAAISQNQTNGASLLGTFHAPKLPHFFTNNPIVDGYPWGTLDCYNSDPYTDAPVTGVTRSYTFNLARGIVAPDGYERETILVNGAYPGPLIEANWGDTVQVTVNNEIDNPPEGTAIHWHGLLQQGNTWMDGVPAVSMCPISPNDSFTYTFQATPYGSTWYHSHYSSQYADGVWGPLVIHGPDTSSYDVDIGPVTLNDYFHRDYFSILEDVMGTDLSKIQPASDNNLINGKMDFDCPSVNSSQNPCVDKAGLSKFNFTSGLRHRLRLINTGVSATQKFSIDNHTMTVIANDFIPLEPYNTSIVTLAVGQRTDVVVQAIGKPTDVYWMRSTITSGSCLDPANQPYGLAAIYYESANRSMSPAQTNSTAQVDTTDPCANEDLSVTVPSFVIPADNASVTINMTLDTYVNETGHFLWTVNNSSFRGDYNNPILLLSKTGNDSYPFDPEWNVYNLGSNATVRVVVTNLTPATHPWHLHGHEMQVLAVGSGTWDGTIVRPSNPQRRDVQIIQAGGYAVFQWQQDNPGVWPFHCHVAWHLSAGLYTNILEQPDEIKHLSIPSTAKQNCRDWATFSGGTLVDQIDSGL